MLAKHGFHRFRVLLGGLHKPGPAIFTNDPRTFVRTSFGYGFDLRNCIVKEGMRADGDVDARRLTELFQAFDRIFERYYSRVSRGIGVDVLRKAEAAQDPDGVRHTVICYR